MLKAFGTSDDTKGSRSASKGGKPSVKCVNCGYVSEHHWYFASDSDDEYGLCGWCYSELGFEYHERLNYSWTSLGIEISEKGTRWLKKVHNLK
jgi:hypothetical protein